MDNAPPCFSKAFFNPYRCDKSWKERFMYLHPGVEAYLRQVLFVGLRRNGVNYQEAREFVYENRLVEQFPDHFKTLFGIDWMGFIQPDALLCTLWDLYRKQTKPVRHRVFHGLRSYDEEFFRMCYAIDLSFVESLSKYLFLHYQHDFLPPLKDLMLPRVGKNGVPPSTVIKKFSAGTKPRYSDTEDDFRQFKLLLSEIGIYSEEGV